MIKKYGLPILIGFLTILFMSGLVNDFLEKSLKTCFTAFAYHSEESKLGAWVEEKSKGILPVFAYSEYQEVVAHREDQFLLKRIKPVELLTMLEYENIGETTEETVIIPEAEVEASVEQSEPVEISETEEVQEAMAISFIPHTLQAIVDVQKLADYDTLIKEFYIVDSVAMVGSDLLNAEVLNNKDLRISKSSDGPQILIYHTHSQEGFVDSVPGDDSTTIIGVGEHLAEILRNNYGYEVLHHTGKYDVESRDNAYSCALPEIQKILEENPSIKVVIDLHRDAVADVTNKLAMDLDGRPTARFMFFNGVSRGKKTGNIDYLNNPNLEDNLAFSFQLKRVAEEYYPGLTRKNYINAYRYNMHLCGRTTLIELGAQNNTLEEAMNACDPIAHILDMVLSGA